MGGKGHETRRNTSSHQTDKIVGLLFCFYVVHSLEKEDFLKTLRILSCFVQLKSVLFNLLALACFAPPKVELHSVREEEEHQLTACSV